MNECSCLIVQLHYFLCLIFFLLYLVLSNKISRFCTQPVRDNFRYANLFEFYLHLPFKAKLENEVVFKDRNSILLLELVEWAIYILRSWVNIMTLLQLPV